MAKQRSIFEEEDESVDLPDNVWKEVPQALFDSWSNERQLAYCVARDEGAALYAHTLEEAQWFVARSKMYREMLCQAKSTTEGFRRLSEEM